MKVNTLQTGFTLVTAIFLLVAVAGLVGVMINLSVVQHSTVAMNVQGARAMQAARSALEYGIYQALAGNCTNDTVSFSTAALKSFTVSLTCVPSTHIESASTVNFYELTATATRGSYVLAGSANPDYISRTIRVTASNEPP